jgi:hypothetical protein
MPTQKQLQEKLKAVLAKTKTPKKISILYMPELPETAPHWLFWLLIASLIALICAAVWNQLPNDSALQTYLPAI